MTQIYFIECYGKFMIQIFTEIMKKSFLHISIVHMRLE